MRTSSSENELRRGGGGGRGRAAFRTSLGPTESKESAQAKSGAQNTFGETRISRFFFGEKSGSGSFPNLLLQYDSAKEWRCGGVVWW